MAIINKATKGDGHGNTIEDLKSYEEKEYTVNGMPSPIHFYYLNDDLITGDETIGIVTVPKRRSLAPLTQSTGIMSINYVPFMPEDRLTLYKYNYDQAYYGNSSGNPDDPADRQTGVFVYKVIGVTAPEGPQPTPYMDYPLKEIDKYPYKKFKQGGGKKHWSNESKLFQYPYHYVTINDYMNTPLQVRMDLIDGNEKYKTNKQFQVKVRQAISINGTYTLYVPYLKGDATGALEGMKSLSPMDLPTASSQYAQFMANNKAQWSTNNMTAFGNALLGNSGRIQAQYNQMSNAWSNYNMADQTKYMNVTGGKNGGGKPMIQRIDNSAIRNAGRKQLIGAGLDVGNEVAGRLFNAGSVIAQAMAKKADMMNAPRNVTLQGGDVMDNITNGNRKVNAIRYHIQEEYLNRLADYFAMYGYKQDKMMNIDLRSRRDYNYIKTIGCNVVGKGVPKRYMAVIKAIFNNGTTLWHMDRNGGKYIDYSTDNTEV